MTPNADELDGVNELACDRMGAEKPFSSRAIQ
jgi:hypothetical protein